MKYSLSNQFVIALLVCLVVTLAACGTRGASAGTSLKIVSDLPLTGSARSANLTIVNAIRMRVDEAGSVACGGKYRILYESHDDASVAAGQ